MFQRSIILFVSLFLYSVHLHAADAVTDACVGKDPDCTRDFGAARILNIEFDLDRKYASYAQYNTNAGKWDVFFAKWDSGKNQFTDRVKLTYQKCNGANCGFTDSLVGMPQLGVFKKNGVKNTVFVVYKNLSNVIVVCDLVKNDFYNPRCKKINPPINMSEFQFPFPIRNKNSSQRYLAYRMANKHPQSNLAREQLWGVNLDASWNPSLIYQELKPFAPAGCAKGADTSRCRSLYTALNRTWWRWQDNTKKLFYGRRHYPMNINYIDASYPTMSANLAVADFSKFGNWNNKAVFDPEYDVIDMIPFKDKNGKNSVVIGKDYHDGLGAILRDNNNTGKYTRVEDFGYKASNPETAIEKGNDFGAQSYEHFQMKDRNGRIHDYVVYVVGDRSTTIHGKPSTNPSATGFWSEVWLHRLGSKNDCVISIPQDSDDRYVQTEPEVVVKKVGQEDRFFVYYNVGDPKSGFHQSFDSFLRRIELNTSIARFNKRCQYQNIWN